MDNLEAEADEELEDGRLAARLHEEGAQAEEEGAQLGGGETEKDDPHPRYFAYNIINLLFCNYI